MTRGRLTAALIGVLVLCLVGGALAAYALGRRTAIAAADSGGNATAVTSTPPPSSAGSMSSSSEVTQATSTHGGRPADPAAPATTGTTRMSPEHRTTPSASEDSEAGDTTVRLAGVATDDPQAAEVRDLVQRHFDAINRRDYRLWATTVSKTQSAAIGPARWREEYSTTTDTNISVILITDDPREVQITFRSRQAPEKAPDSTSDCLNWVVTLPLVVDSGDLVLGTSVEDRARWTPCHAE